MLAVTVVLSGGRVEKRALYGALLLLLKDRGYDVREEDEKLVVENPYHEMGGGCR
jgi:hypothetical protein